jgi:arrestin-related trafficking adapter 9
MPLETLFSNPNPTVPRTRSILSRFRSPLAKHSRNISEFYIEPENPWKTYSPGDIVKGYVTLTVAKGLDVTHLAVALHGYAKVYKHQVVPGEGNPEAELLVNGKGNSGFEYHGNGLASLFQDEIVLCGSGFLKRQTYKFGFELEFPSGKLPSTIEVCTVLEVTGSANRLKFERGTVSYVISATLTKPTAIAPTATCSRRIQFQENIDIGPLSTPKSRVLSLEPISKRGRVKKMRPSPSVHTQETRPAGDLIRINTNVSTPIARGPSGVAPPLSPAPSEDTIASTTTTSNQSFQVVKNPSTTTGSGVKASDSRSTTTSSSANIITATVDLLKQGALPGDTIPIRILVSHTKPNLRGIVIVTLYRQGRIDMHPVIPVGRKGKDKQAEYEDIYPRSRTGLGGLYFSNQSPSSLFRMDLAQSSTMMVVDPRTLVADVKTSIRVPENAFPTIANVPGDMISFKYYVEVVVDLCGKLGETRLLPSLTSNGPTFTYASENNNQLTSEWANNILDTSQLRRTKNVVSFTFSLVVGTQDSSRNAHKQEELDSAEQQGREEVRAEGLDDWNDGYNYDYEYDGWYPNEQEYHTYPTYPSEGQNYQSPFMEPIPPPEPEEQVDEKTRLRRQEELLLPSRPPQEGESSNSAAAFAPSAPYLSEDIISPLLPNNAPSGISTRSADTVIPSGEDSVEPPAFHGEGDHLLAEDKQELERRRLMAQASAPPGDGEVGPSGSAVSALAPSAPVIDEEEEYNAQTLNDINLGGDHLPLPQYQR